MIIALLFVGSGCAALIYEIVWFQLLELVIGSSGISLGVLLGTFMGGMCLGSLLLPRLVSAQHHPLRVYALLEAGIGIIGVAVLWGVPYIGGLYVAIGSPGLWGILLRGLICGICLLPPTLLMGATLPAIARWVKTNPEGISWLGFFYGSNIAGAIFGSLLAGFYLLRVHDMATATYVAASINLAVALIGFRFARRTSYSIPADDLTETSDDHAKTGWPVYVVIAISGMCALGAEVVWTRLLSLLLGGSVYTFSLILAVFLLGLGIGSSFGASRSRSTRTPQFDLGVCQMLLCAAIAWAAYMISSSLPYWPIDAALSKNAWFTFQLHLLVCMWAILPAAFLWGASFPLALAAVATHKGDAGRLVAGVYAANTVGGIAGALGFSLIFVKSFGTQHAQQALIVLSSVAALLVLARSRRALSLLAAAFAVVFVLAVPPVNGALIAYGRFLSFRLGLRDAQTKAPFVPNILYAGEGMNASIAVSGPSAGVRNFHVSGKIEASNLPYDLRLERMLGFIPALNHPWPRSVLIVGFGAGITAGTFVLDPTVERIVICEIEPLIPEVVSRYFGIENYNVLKDPRVEVVYDDARHYILTTREKFDIITSDPIHPWVKGAATLYTREYFELVKRHLNPGGTVSQWVPLYESGHQTVKSEIATFFEAFPNGTVWSSNLKGSGYDLVLLGKDGPATINLDDLQRRLNRADHRALNQSLQGIGFPSATELLASYAGQGADLAPWLRDAEINHDRNLRLQYIAGMELNSDEDSIIYDNILSYSRFPDELFVGSDGLKQQLREALDRRKSR
jgi:spermidine synthase